ncbi:MAG: AraC family transcriptional regulator [Solirubrobacteraceae bacterium]
MSSDAGRAASKSARSAQHLETARAVPTAPLRGLIAAYDGYCQRGLPPATHLGLPSPFLTFIVTLYEPLQIVEHLDRRRAPQSYASLIGGLHTTPAVVAHEGAQSGVQLRVSPLASRALFGVPAGELAGLDLDAQQLIGKGAARLQERLAAAQSWPERFATLDGALRTRLADAAPPTGVAAAWRLLLASGGTIEVSALAREVGYSTRRLSALCGVEIGLTPKLAGRVIRFHRARHMLQARLARAERPEIAAVAAACGYHDQPHLDRDFRDFAGVAPSTWAEQEFRNVQAVELPDHLN